MDVSESVGGWIVGYKFSGWMSGYSLGGRYYVSGWTLVSLWVGGLLGINSLGGWVGILCVGGITSLGGR